MIDLYDRNIFHIAAEHDRGDVIHAIVKHMLAQNHQTSNPTLGFYRIRKMLLKRDNEEFHIPRLYIDPHRYAYKYLCQLENLLFHT